MRERTIASQISGSSVRFPFCFCSLHAGLNGFGWNSQTGLTLPVHAAASLSQKFKPFFNPIKLNFDRISKRQKYPSIRNTATFWSQVLLEDEVSGLESQVLLGSILSSSESWGVVSPNFQRLGFVNLTLTVFLKSYLHIQPQRQWMELKLIDLLISFAWLTIHTYFLASTVSVSVPELQSPLFYCPTPATSTSTRFSLVV